MVLISATMAHRLWDAQDPVGRHLIADGRDCEIVGVVEDAKINNVHGAAEPYMYFPFAQVPSAEGTLIAEITGDEEWDHCYRPRSDPQCRCKPACDDRHNPALLRLAFWRDLTATWLVGTLGALGVFLAAVGLYGIISHRVSQRRRELGIRMALSAPPRPTSCGWCFNEVALAGIGTGVGLIASFGAARLMSSMLYGVRPTDPLAFTASAVIVLVVALAASWGPARRALKVDPLQALRCESEVRRRAVDPRASSRLPERIEPPEPFGNLVPTRANWGRHLDGVKITL